MSILIKGLDVTALNDDSSVCYKDIRIFADGSATTSSGEHPYIKTFEWIEVPTPHGDLVDRDVVAENIRQRLGIRNLDYLLETEKPIAMSIKEAPAIIESEE